MEFIIILVVIAVIVAAIRITLVAAFTGDWKLFTLIGFVMVLMVLIGLTV